MIVIFISLIMFTVGPEISLGAPRRWMNEMRMSFPEAGVRVPLTLAHPSCLFQRIGDTEPLYERNIHLQLSKL